MDLRNTYWLLRHGRSYANEADLIVSHMENGVDPKYGLTAVGKEQAVAAGAQLKEELGLPAAEGGAAAAAAAAVAEGRLRVLASPFSRTLQTAELAASQLGLDGGIVQEAPDLRERHFGDYELQSCSNYELVWAEDARDTTAQPPGGGESVADVAARMRCFIAGLESAHSGCHIVLVSHGDALSILAAVLLGGELGAHRQHGLPNCGILRVPAVAAAAARE